MRFELSAEQAAARDRARDFVHEQLTEAAPAIDRSGAIAASLVREAAGLIPPADPLALVVVVEELATASPAVAAAAGFGAQKGSGAGPALHGLRGFSAAADQPTDRAGLTLAAVALGIGRAAVDRALDAIREAQAATTKGEEKPHWVLADAATEVEAARMLTLQAAQALSAGEATSQIGMARLLASGAADRAVAAAVRIVGADALGEGALLERLSRDVRAIGVLLGTEEDHRAAAAQAVLPSS